VPASFFFAKKQALTRRKSAAIKSFGALHEHKAEMRIIVMAVASAAPGRRIDPRFKNKRLLAGRTRYLNEYSACIVHSTRSTPMQRSCGVFAHHFLFFSPERMASAL
jgi:hypothetical protein